MIWGDEDKLRRAFHPQALQVGHFAETYEFFPLEEFLSWFWTEEKLPPGLPYIAELISIEVTGTVAIAKVTDTCFGSDFTDYLVLVKDRLTPDGRWQIVTKAYHVHSWLASVARRHVIEVTASFHELRDVGNAELRLCWLK